MFCSKNIICKEVIALEKKITEMIVKDMPIRVIRINGADYITLTDLAKYQNSSYPSFTVKIS